MQAFIGLREDKKEEATPSRKKGRLSQVTGRHKHYQSGAARQSKEPREEFWGTWRG